MWSAKLPIPNSGFLLQCHVGPHDHGERCVCVCLLCVCVSNQPAGQPASQETRPNETTSPSSLKGLPSAKQPHSKTLETKAALFISDPSTQALIWLHRWHSPLPVVVNPINARNTNNAYSKTPSHQNPSISSHIDSTQLCALQFSAAHVWLLCKPAAGDHVFAGPPSQNNPGVGSQQSISPAFEGLQGPGGVRGPTRPVAAHAPDLQHVVGAQQGALLHVL